MGAGGMPGWIVATDARALELTSAAAAKDISAVLLRRHVRAMTRGGFSAAEIALSLSLSEPEVAELASDRSARGGYVCARGIELDSGDVTHELLAGPMPDAEVFDLCAMVGRLAYALNAADPSAALAPRALALLSRLGYDFIPRARR